MKPQANHIPREDRCHPDCPGWSWSHNGEVQRCDACGRFAHTDAARAHIEALAATEAGPVAVLRDLLHGPCAAMCMDDGDEVMVLLAMFAECLCETKAEGKRP